MTQRLSSAVSRRAQYRSILFCRCKTADMAVDLIIDGRSMCRCGYADVDTGMADKFYGLVVRFIMSSQ
jgi:hypothetical protein